MFLGFDANTWQIIGAVIAVILFICAIISFIVKCIFSVGKFSNRLENVEDSVKGLKGDIRETRKDLTDRIDNLMSLVKISAQSGLSVSNSPRRLSDEGKRVLENSGTNEIVDDKFDLIVKEVTKRKPENSYQAEKDVFDVVEGLISDPVIKDAMENGAFQSGYPLPAVLFVAGLYIRDRVLKKLGFDVDEIDKNVPTK